MKLKRITETENLPGSDLPLDYLAMVSNVFESNFEKGMKLAADLTKSPALSLSGTVYPDEIRLTLTVTYGDDIKATSFHASADYDPQASKPTAEEVLGDCVDALGALFGGLFMEGNRKLIAPVFEDSLAGIENIPYEWSEFKSGGKRSVYLMVDKANPKLDQMATDWLKQNDPAMKDKKDDEAESEEFLAERLEKIKEDEENRSPCLDSNYSQ